MSSQPAIPPTTPDILKTFIKRCFQHKPKMFTIEELLNDPFILSYASRSENTLPAGEGEFVHAGSNVRYRATVGLAKGGFGTVYRGSILSKNWSGEEDVAIKKLDAGFVTTREVLETFGERFGKTLNRIFKQNHPNVVKYYGSCFEYPADLKEVPVPVVIMEFCGGETLDSYIVRNGRFTEIKTIELTHQILSALDYLHRIIRLSHTDIKTKNIVFKDDQHQIAKICDLDSPYVLEGSKTSSGDKSIMLSVPYFSPEMAKLYLEGGVKVGRKTDIWSFGCVVLEMFSDSLQKFVSANIHMPIWSVPTDNRSEPLEKMLIRVARIVSGGEKPRIPEGTSSFLRELIEMCLTMEPDLRPKAAALLALPVYSGFATIIGSEIRDEYDSHLSPYTATQVREQEKQHSIVFDDIDLD